MSTQSFTENDLVTLHPTAGRKADRNRVFKIAELNTGTGRVVLVDATGRDPIRIVGDTSILVPYEGPAPEVVEIDPRLSFVGATARVTKTGIDPKKVFVVLGMASRKPGHVKLAVLGGDNGRYYIAVPLTDLTYVDPSSLA